MNNIYDNARYQMLTASFDWLGWDLEVVAWAGTPDFVPTDKKISDIKARGTIELGSSMPITSKTVAPNGTAQTNGVLIPGVPIGESVTWFTLDRKSLTHNEGELLLFIDEALYLPFDPNGLDIVIQPDWFQNRGWFRP